LPSHDVRLTGLKSVGLVLSFFLGIILILALFHEL